MGRERALSKPWKSRLATEKAFAAPIRQAITWPGELGCGATAFWNDRSYLVLAGPRRAFEQRPGRHDEPRRADAALERRVLEELLLQGMQPLRRGDALDGGDGSPLDL